MTVDDPDVLRPELDAKAAMARRKLLGILSSTWLAQGIYALAELGIADHLAAGPMTVDKLAVASGANPLALSRLLRALALAGLFTHEAPDTFGLTATTDLLRSDVPGSVRLNALMQGDEVFRSFADIMHTMRTGRPAFEHVYGTGFYQYLQDNPHAAATFHQSMGAQPTPAAIFTCDLAAAQTVVDVGGGNGGLLIDLLSAAPDQRGVLLELADALEQARHRLAAAGLTERVDCVEGSFFDGVPAGGDVYVLSRVLHNWADDRAADILRQVHAAMPPTARLIVAEELLPEPDDHRPAGAARSAAGMIDLLMLVTLEGRDRTETEYRSLLASTGFEVIAARRASGSATDGVLEARPR